jgi:outer membrane protein
MTLLFSLLPAAAAADRVLTLDQVLRLARERNRTLQAAAEELAAARAAADRALAPLLPQASAQARIFRNDPEIRFMLPAGFLPGGRTEVVISPTTQIDATLTATLPLLVPSAYGGVRAARAQERAEVSRLRAAGNDVAFAVARAFFAVAGAEEVLVAREHAVKVTEEALRTTGVRRAAGVARAVDVTRAELQAVRARQALREAGDAVAAARRALGTALALGEPVRAEAPPTVRWSPPAEADLVREAIAARPDVAAAREQVGAAERALSAARWRLAPNLLAFANLRGFNNPGFAPVNYAWAAGVLLDVPLIEPGRYTDLRATEARLRQAQVRLAQITDGVADEVRNARDALGTSHARLESAERAVALARTALDLVRIQREAGIATQLEEIDAQDRLVTSQIALAQARFELALADLALKRSAGRPVQ